MHPACRHVCVIRRFRDYRSNLLVSDALNFGCCAHILQAWFSRQSFYDTIATLLLGCLHPLVANQLIRGSCMPIYEYQCESCNHALEALQKLSDAPLVDCPACGKASLKKQISAAGFRLSGGGWYETDFKSGKKKNLAGDAGSSSASSGSTSSAASTTTPSATTKAS